MLLLLTGTIDPAVFNNTNVKVTSAEERLGQYVDSIRKYISLDMFSSVVFVENSGYAFPIEEMQALANKHNAEFEIVRITTDIQKTITLGKSYGEADCIEQGLRKSELAKNEEYFVKCTGRVFVRNLDKMCKKHRNANRFVIREDRGWCYSVVFQMNTAEYLEKFSCVKAMCNEAEGIDIETAMYNVIVNKNVKFRAFRTYPYIEGVCGTTGENYTREYGFLNFLVKIGFFDINFLSKHFYRKIIGIGYKLMHFFK